MVFKYHLYFIDGQLFDGRESPKIVFSSLRDLSLYRQSVSVTDFWGREFQYISFHERIIYLFLFPLHQTKTIINYKFRLRFKDEWPYSIARHNIDQFIEFKYHYYPSHSLEAWLDLDKENNTSILLQFIHNNLNPNPKQLQLKPHPIITLMRDLIAITAPNDDPQTVILTLQCAFRRHTVMGSDANIAAFIQKCKVAFTTRVEPILHLLNEQTIIVCRNLLLINPQQMSIAMCQDIKYLIMKDSSKAILCRQLLMKYSNGCGFDMRFHCNDHIIRNFVFGSASLNTFQGELPMDLLLREDIIRVVIQEDEYVDAAIKIAYGQIHSQFPWSDIIDGDGRICLSPVEEKNDNDNDDI